ncbi:MAG: hypothetical protein IPG34_19550 [Rhodocyclaceae bacterium]|nr:hypothetical protein [Rhodocyclaceae bacterium]
MARRAKALRLGASDIVDEEDHAAQEVAQGSGSCRSVPLNGDGLLRQVRNGAKERSPWPHRLAEGLEVGGNAEDV